MFVKLGSIGPQVAELHQILIEVGYDVGLDAGDRVFGRDTYAAVLKFQSEHFGPDGEPLKIDGIVGDKTWWALQNPGAEPKPGGTIPSQNVNGRIAKKALEAALEELARGVKEIPPGSNRGERVDMYTGWSGKPENRKGPPWCAFFVSWCFGQNPEGSPFGSIGGALNIGHWGHRQNCAIDAGSMPALAGDIFVINRDGIHGHTGIVRAVDGNQIWTVEGNSGNAVRSIPRAIDTVQTLVRIRP